MGSEVDIMNVVLEMENWIVNDEYFITQGLNEYEVYNCGDDAEEAKEHKPKVVFVDDENKISRVTNYEKHGLLKDQEK